jgi:hypothetical protein
VCCLPNWAPFFAVSCSVLSVMPAE